MHFKSSRLPSSSKDVKWYWERCVRENIDFSRVTINESQIDFTKPVEFKRNVMFYFFVNIKY